MADTFITPSKIINGVGALQAAGSEFVNMGEKPLIVTDSMMEKLGNLKKVTDVLTDYAMQYSVYAEVNHEPDDGIVQAGVDQYKKDRCDCIIAIGGGSPIDTMKAIAVMVTEECDLSEKMGKEITNRTPKIAAIPTTAGTGSEATQFTIITDRRSQVKMLLKGAVLIPDLAVIDPQFTMTAPASVTAATGIDALCHAIEAYTSKKAQPLSNVFALSAAKRIFKNLKTAYDSPQDVEARNQMALAATEAGIAFNNSSVTIIHGMSRPIGALFHVAHGLSNAMLMEECLQYVKDGAITQFAEIATYCGMTTKNMLDIDAANCLLEEIKKLLKGLNIPTLREFGIDPKEFESMIEKMANDAKESGSPSNTRKEIGLEDMEYLYRRLIIK